MSDSHIGQRRLRGERSSTAAQDASGFDDAFALSKQVVLRVEFIGRELSTGGVNRRVGRRRQHLSALTRNHVARKYRAASVYNARIRT